jgi:uncharacterized protein (TIGR02246 family)
MIKMLRWGLTALLLTIAPLPAFAGPAEDAAAVLAKWSAAYTANNPDAIVANYWPDAILLGTVSPVVSTGTAALQKYFAAVRGSGNRNDIDEIHTIVIDDGAVLLTGFYTFTRMTDGKATPGPSRFTMLIVKRDGVWHIAHHHSSPRVLAK